MSFGYPQIYANGINNMSQLRRGEDFVYQRGATYQVVLTGSSLQPSIELVVNLFTNDNLVGNMAIVPYQTSQSGSTYYYYFNIRPYTYFQNYVEAQHYQYYWSGDFDSTNQTININNPYPNGVKVNVQYGYRFLSGGTYNYEYTGGTTTPNQSLQNFNDYNHYTLCGDQPVAGQQFPISGFTNTGKYFDLFGGTFEFNNNYILQNFDQELGTNLSPTNNWAPYGNVYEDASPISRYDMNWPSAPEQSTTGKFLTYAPRIQYIQETESYNLFFLNGQSGDRFVNATSYILFDFYDINNNLINRYTQEINKSGTTYSSPTDFTDNYKIFALPCGPQELKSVYNIDLSTGNTAYYRVQLYDGYPTWNTGRTSQGPISPTSEIFYFYLYNNCRPENTRLCWLNELGGYDYFTFVSYRQDTKQITRTNYDNRYYATNLQSADRNIGRSKKTFDTNVTQQIIIDTGYLNVETGNWLEGLFLSPQVYIIQEDFVSNLDVPNKIYKSLSPVIITSTTVDTITKKHSKLNKYRITLTTSDSYFVNKGF